MQAYDWTRRIRELYDKALRHYREGHRAPSFFGVFTPEEERFLESIGASPAELYDYAEDASDLDWETALLILSVRRDYFLFVQRGQRGQSSARRLTMEEFPAKNAELDGIRWLPRLILKAKGRLHGELPVELMYCCGGDRAFFRKYNLHPADFLRFFWSVDGDEAKVLAWVKNAA